MKGLNNFLFLKGGGGGGGGERDLLKGRYKSERWPL